MRVPDNARIKPVIISLKKYTQFVSIYVRKAIVDTGMKGNLHSALPFFQLILLDKAVDKKIHLILSRVYLFKLYSLKVTYIT